MVDDHYHPWRKRPRPCSLNTFPAFEQARKERLELLAKIKREKEARLAARKAA